MVWPMDETRYGLQEFEGIVSETLVRTLDKRTGATRLMWRKIAPSQRTTRLAGLLPRPSKSPGRPLLAA